MSQINLVVQTAFLGDLILSIPVLQRIKQIFPAQSLAVVCKKGLGDFLMKENIADIVFEVEKSNANSYAEVKRELSRFKINNIFCIHRSLRSLLFVAGLTANKKIGYSSFAGFWVFDETVEYIKEYPDVIRQFKILEPVDGAVRMEFAQDGYEVLNDVQHQIPGFFEFAPQPHQTNHKKIAIFPGSVWATKRWTEEGFENVGQMLTKMGYQVELLGGPDEKPLCEKIAGKIPGAKVLAGKMSIAETIKNLQDYDLVISNDSAPTHMAAYKGVPIVTIFGPTTKELGFRPWSNQAKIVENNSINCRPCGAHGHQVCPLTHHECMKTISATQVYGAIEELLKLSNPAD
jgi:heptosyltransferase-2